MMMIFVSDEWFFARRIKNAFIASQLPLGTAQFSTPLSRDNLRYPVCAWPTTRAMVKLIPSGKSYAPQNCRFSYDLRFEATKQLEIYRRPRANRFRKQFFMLISRSERKTRFISLNQTMGSGNWWNFSIFTSFDSSTMIFLSQRKTNLMRFTG